MGKIHEESTLVARKLLVCILTHSRVTYTNVSQDRHEIGTYLEGVGCEEVDHNLWKYQCVQRATMGMGTGAQTQREQTMRNLTTVGDS